MSKAPTPEINPTPLDTAEAEQPDSAGCTPTPGSASSRNLDLAMTLIESMGTLGRAAAFLAKTCQWSEDLDGNWDTACGECFTFTDGGPNENKVRWCCYCGGELVAVPHPQNGKG